MGAVLDDKPTSTPGSGGSAAAAGTGARRGADVLRRLRDHPPTIWYGGERVHDVTVHPALRGGVETLAHLYDLQWQKADRTLFDSPSSGRKVARSFMLPKTHEELRGISAAMKVWEDHTHGMMGRVPDYINRAMSGYAAGASFLGEAEPRFGANAIRYHEYLRENDLCLTHTLIPPQANRAVGAARQADPYLAARVKEETDAGIVIRGCRMLATLPISDEIMVFPSTVLKSPEEDAPYAFGFSIPNHTPGLRFICRESVDYGRSHFDHPLGSRYEEMDAVVVFDDVFVGWENVLLYRDVNRCNQAYARTGAVVHMTHQVVVKNIAKAEFMLGLAHLLVDSIGAEGFQHIHEKLSELWVSMETMKAFLRAAEADAAIDEWGVMRPAWNPLDAARNLFPRLYPRMVEIIQQIGASGLVAMPVQADLEGPLVQDIKRYYQAARAEAFDRIPLFRLAWDASMSAFASRQVLYERFFFGDPVRMAGALVASHKSEIQEQAERVRAFVREGRDEAFSDAR
jgi:4-hydroxyphenylacetate 3-monooxygenase